MRKLFLPLICFILLAFVSSTGARMSLMIVTPQTPAASAVDYTADGNCQGAWFMSGDGGTDEVDTDQSGNSLNIAETGSDEIDVTADRPSGYSGSSRDNETADDEALFLADGSAGGLDISGVDAKVSIVAWIKGEDIVDTVEYAIVGKGDYTSNQRSYQLIIIGTGAGTFKVRMSVDANGSGWDVNLDSTTTNYAAGTWYHVAGVANDTDVRIYVNGSLDSTPAAHTGGLFNSSTDFVVGGNRDAADCTSANCADFDGLIDEVAVFDRELSAAEVSDIYTNGIDGTKGGNDL
jgi:hypothetical protein